jgi:uncharacterized protein YbcI
VPLEEHRKIMVNKSNKTAGQIERDAIQAINALYRNELGHQPGKITCQLFEKKAVLIIENALSKPEQLLLEQGDNDVALKAHQALLEVFKEKAKDCLAQALTTPVLDLLLDSNIEEAHIGIIAILEDAPEVKKPSAIPKNPRSDSST